MELLQTMEWTVPTAEELAREQRWRRFENWLNVRKHAWRQLRWRRRLEQKRQQNRLNQLDFPMLTPEQTNSTTPEQMIRIWCGHTKHGSSHCACFCCVCVYFAVDVKYRELELVEFDGDVKGGEPPGFAYMMQKWSDFTMENIRWRARGKSYELNPTLADVVRDHCNAAEKPGASSVYSPSPCKRLEQARCAPSWEAAAIAELRNRHLFVSPGSNPPPFRDSFHLKVRFYESVKGQLYGGVYREGRLPKLPRPF